MFNFAIRRLLQMVPMIFVLSLVIFTLQAISPGDPTDEIRFSNPRITAEQLQAIRHAQGLDQPIYVRYFKWLGRAVQGDFGLSRQYGVPVLQKVFVDAMPKTLLLTGSAFLISLLIAIPVGIYSATRQFSFVDNAVTFFTFIGYAIPAFVMGIFLLYVFGVGLPRFSAEHFPSFMHVAALPPVGNVPYSTVADIKDGSVTVGGYIKNWVLLLILPVASIALREIAVYSRFMRGSMLEVLGQDYVRTARAKGLSENAVVLRHAFRNSLVPIVTLVGLSIPGVMSGALVTEAIFSYRGMGLLTLNALQGKDYNLAMVAILFLGIMTMLFYLITDLMYAVVDPRIRYN